MRQFLNKNRLCIRALPLIIALSVLPTKLFGQFAFATNNGLLTVIGYTGPGGSVIIPGNTNGMPVAAIGDSAFSSKLNVTDVTIPNSVTNIGSYAFYRCGNMTNAPIPSGVRSIGDYAFQNCTNLTGIVIPVGTRSIGVKAFQGCVNLTSITIKGNITQFGGYAFAQCARVTNVALSSFVTTVGTYAFWGCTNMTTVTISNGIRGIESDAFLGCRALPTVTIPGSVTNIGDYAFYGCYSLTNATISNGVVSIGTEPFIYTGLPQITVPASVTNIGILAFAFSTNLTNITVDPQNLFYSSLEGVLFDKSQAVLLEYPPARNGDYTIPSTVTNIQDNAFNSCLKIGTITIPDGTLRIGHGAFIYSSLSNVAIAPTVTEIGGNAFAACTNLTRLVIPASVTYIWSYSFSYCSNLTSVYFLGDRPATDFTLFLGDTLTIYYLPGKTGWISPFAGLPALLWNPLIETGRSDFGWRSNHFGFTVTGTTNIPISLDACTNLEKPVWVTLQTCSLTNGMLYFVDDQSPTCANRFYRIVAP